jgi:hypothetical protein
MGNPEHPSGYKSDIPYPADLGALIAYFKSVPAVDHATSDLVVTTPLVRIHMAAAPRSRRLALSRF